MNKAFYLIDIALFLLAAPALLSVRFVRPKRMPWWLLGILAALCGWVFSNLSVFFYYEHLYDLVIEAGGVEVAPADLVDDWQADGAKRVFAFLFGWLYGLVYLIPWLFVYGLFCLVIRSYAR